MTEQLTTLALAGALAWASGIRLYVVLFLVGLAGHFQWFGWHPPKALALLSHPIVMGATGLLLFVEFFADKIPALDSLWGAVHTFIRIPAGALLAAGVLGHGDSEAWTLAAALLGGTITAGTHFFKEGSRAAINTSPEPVSNIAASMTEDAAVLGGLWLAIQHPLVFLGLLLLFILIAIWLIPKLLRFVRGVIQRLVHLVSPPPGTRPPNATA
ncbi:MAG TPA: DUF4126 domain-containing protein [Usitatibacteraceae bacterium]|nr:DUF4126 domain-containing protein [Usitatibacteraceae bacterium]